MARKFLLMAIQYIQSHFLAKYGQTRNSFATTSMGLWLSAIADDIGVGLIHNIVLRIFLLYGSNLNKWPSSLSVKKWRWKWGYWYREMAMRLSTSLLRLYKNILKGSFYRALIKAGNAGIFGAFPAFFIGHHLGGCTKILMMVKWSVQILCFKWQNTNAILKLSIWCSAYEGTVE